MIITWTKKKQGTGYFSVTSIMALKLGCVYTTCIHFSLNSDINRWSILFFAVYTLSQTVFQCPYIIKQTVLIIQTTIWWISHERIFCKPFNFFVSICSSAKEVIFSAKCNHILLTLRCRTIWKKKNHFSSPEDSSTSYKYYGYSKHCIQATWKKLRSVTILHLTFIKHTSSPIREFN